MTIETGFNPASIILGTRTIYPGSSPAAGLGNANANAEYVQKYTATQSFTALAGNILFYTQSTTCKTKFLIYADSSGSPGVLLASSAEVVGTFNGEASWLEYILLSPLSIVSGQSYWIGWMEDVGILVYRDFAVSVPYKLAPRTYTSGPLDPWSGTTSQGNNGIEVYISDHIRIPLSVATEQNCHAFFNVL